MTYDPAKYAADSAKSAIDKMMAEVANARAEVAKLKTDVSKGGVTKLEQYPWGQAKHCKSYGSPASARAELTKLYEASKPIGEKNAEAAKHNQQLANAAVAYLTAMGVPDTYRKLKSSRSYKTVTVEAEWKTALRLAFPTASDWPHVEERYAASMREIDAWEKAIAAEEYSRKIAAEADERSNRYTKLAASMAQRYGLEVAADADDVFDAVIGSDKYLRLAYWLERNRGDWSDGHDYAEIGLRHFTEEDDQDREVTGCITGLISDWDGDGRCFRDCEWNYSRLYEIAGQRNPQALADYTALSEVKPCS